MQFTFDTILFLISSAFVAGGIDALAGGGGLVTIPALMAAGIPPVSALATNKLQSTIGTSSAFLTFLRAGHVDIRQFVLPAIGAFLGALAGATVVQFVNPIFLSAIVPLLLIGMAAYFLLAPPLSGEDRHARLGRMGITLCMTSIGFYDGFFGPGTGSFLTTVLVAFAGLGLVRAIANTKFINLLTNVAGLTAMIVGGKVLWMLGFGMAGANILGNQVGAWLAIRYGGKGIRPLLVIMSLALTVKLLANPDNPLWKMF
ncbi:hypothetical protein BJI49_13940 [Acetobacter pasteurianus]|nr:MULTISPECIES: TSUP family transporter [Acetobacter]GBR55059.1 hypothetical protein AA18889_0002 [Acetobacter senegalensis DSM 18889]ANA15227.1 hypothetical protein WG31_13975 [Acetobacter oryzifermentans]ARW48992.1 UPF0721 transmembrane protein ORF9 [Acetobacter pasteurianus subsp. pasteurianus]ARW49249.1 UPF0721 transmembrane protein ORF9 [Acetobacter pasteurianus subsp. pasteurianus]ASC07384.1 UPF0721 transmembrane protein ORF9 [Acetobacter pasteurianus subsp. pasteurianus]